MTPNDSPALKERSPNYPVRFNDAVPKRVLMSGAVFQSGAHVLPDSTVEVHVDSNGNVFGIIGEQLLFLPPYTFGVIEWHPVNCCPLCGLPGDYGHVCGPCGKAASEEIKAMHA